ncbi:MAG: hypothetical protein QOJ41_582, partial [Acidobacteriaceae bacterium]|nr:hypothetical protein [Acidobacteriaceae bacterium]
MDSKAQSNERQNRAELVDEPRCLAGIAGQWSKNALNVQIVAGVQNCSHRLPD